MGKLSDLDLQIKELRSCGESIIEIANTLAGMFSSQAAEDAPPKEKPKALTLEEVRHRMTVIAQAGHSAEVKALITKYGARKLSDIDPSKFEGLLKEADALGKPEAGTDGEAFLPFRLRKPQVDQLPAVGAALRGVCGQAQRIRPGGYRLP